MSAVPDGAREATRITCMTHHLLASRMTERLVALAGGGGVLAESARCVRQRVRRRALGMPGQAVRFEDSPMDIFRVTVRREAAVPAMQALAEAGELHTPGRGTLYAQEVLEYSEAELPVTEAPTAGGPPRMLHDLTLLTGILSMTGSGDPLARIALRLGACVPVISLGTGTGIRDRLGLLRVTIPPEKEIVHMLVPAHDADGIQRLLVEEGRLARPGGGFLYCTPARAGIADSMLRIGRQEHAASIEQIIAAVDDLKAGTGWRKRLARLEDPRDAARRHLQRDHVEISFICPEGCADARVRAAQRAGAGGATTSRVRCLGAAPADAAGAARERGILCVQAAITDRVLEALRGARGGEASGCRIQILKVQAVFSHQRPNP